MLIGLAIRDVVLIEGLDLSFGPGLTALTGETGAGKSIILDALGLATGVRADASLVRRGATQAVATAIFAPGADDAVWTYLDDTGLGYDRDEDLVLRRVVTADGRSRAFIDEILAGARQIAPDHILEVFVNDDRRSPERHNVLKRLRHDVIEIRLSEHGVNPLLSVL